MSRSDKTPVNTYIAGGTALYLRGLARDAGMVQTKGRAAGQGSISELLERLATALETGAIDVRVLAYEGHEEEDAKG